MDSNDNTENECSDGAKLPPFAAIVKDAINKCLLLPGRSLTATFSFLAEAAVKRARKNLIIYS